MKRTNTILSIFFFLLFASVSFAQDCEFTLELSDSFGDGWNGASVDVDIDGVVTNYTVPSFPSDPFFASYPITISGAQSISITYNTGGFDNEASYQLIGPLGDIIFADGVNPLIGLAFTGEVECPACLGLLASGVSLSDIRAFSVDINLVPIVDDATFSFEYGLAGFVQGTGQVVTTSDVNYMLSGLLQDSDYEVYISSICADGEMSTFLQPYSFTTLIAIDLGIVGVTAPVSGCDLSIMDVIQIEIHNYGGAPQSLIPFNFSVNDSLGSVNHPIDGVYTGVLGIDSTDIMNFDMEYDFSEYGEYEIVAWTEMEGDTVYTNDTFHFTLINKPLISDFPVYIDFENESENYSGWSLGLEGQNQSFELGQPNAPLISTAASGQNAWVTNLMGTHGFNELSYIESPCYDFSNQDADMIFDFVLFANANLGFFGADGMWLESSVDAGENWIKVGTAGSGTNWYNTADPLLGDVWSGAIANEWAIASHTLDGLAGEEDVRLRFVFSAPNFPSLEGFGVDNIYIHPALTTDASVFGGHTTSNDFCGSAADHVAVSLFNHGQVPISNITINYQVNDGPVVTELAAGLILLAGAQETYTFFTPFSSLNMDGYTITIWIDEGDDNLINNVTVFYVTSNIQEAPLSENFETSEFAIPSNWTTSGFIAAPLAHNNPTFNLAQNIYSGNPLFTTTTPFYGTIEENATLTFDYRYTVWSAGVDAHPLAGDNLQIQVAPYCTEDYTTIYTIDETNHITSADFTNISIDLSEYAGEALSFRFLGTWASGDYWLDIDNINVAGLVGANDITLVKEAQLLPNPTSGLATLQVEFLASVDAEIVVSNLLGQQLININDKNVRQGEYTLDITNEPSGVYFVSIRTGNKVKTLKLIKS